MMDNKTYRPPLMAIFFSLSVSFFNSVSGKEVCQLNDIKVRAVLGMDTSKSVDDTSFNLAKKFVGEFINFVGHMESTHPPELAVFQYSGNTKMMINLTTPKNWTTLAHDLAYKSWLYERNEVNYLVSNSGKALNLIGKILGKSDNEPVDEEVKVLKLGFVLTDGQTKDKELLLEEISSLRGENVSLYAIGVGEECGPDTEELNLDTCLNVTELNLITGNENNTFNVKEYKKLSNITEPLLARVCEDLQSNLLQIAALGIGTLVGIAILSLVGVVILIAIQKHIRDKIAAAQLAAQAEALRNRQSVRINPLYEDKEN